MKRHFEDHLRVRVCGILIQDKKILLVNHKGLNPSGVFLSPPGGGVQFLESMENTLKREFLEETGLQIEVKDFLFFDEFIQGNVHAIEFFFKTEITGGNLITGTDPEENEQLIQHVGFYALEELKSLETDSLHARLKHIQNLEDLLVSNDLAYKR